jgi:hypothetical protein
LLRYCCIGFREAGRGAIVVADDDGAARLAVIDVHTKICATAASERTCHAQSRTAPNFPFAAWHPIPPTPLQHSAADEPTPRRQWCQAPSLCGEADVVCRPIVRVFSLFLSRHHENRNRYSRPQPIPLPSSSTSPSALVPSPKSRQNVEPDPDSRFTLLFIRAYIHRRFVRP